MTQLKWPGFNEVGSAIIPLTWGDPGLPEKRVCFRGEWFEPKDELHVTVISKQTGILLRERADQDPATRALIQQDFETIDWQYVPAGPVHVLSRPAKEGEAREPCMSHEKTIILRIDMPGMALFFDALKSRGLLSRDAPVPPPHITLYTRNCPGGIGLPGEDRLLELTEEVLPVSELDEICRSS